LQLGLKFETTDKEVGDTKGEESLWYKSKPKYGAHLYVSESQRNIGLKLRNCYTPHAFQWFRY